MSESNTSYERIRGKGRDNLFHGSTVRMFLGLDHLLQISTAEYRETYRRYYYRDIQAIVVRHSNYRLYANIIMGSIFVLLALAGSATLGNVISIVFYCLAAIMAVALIDSNVRGASVIVFLRTAVGSDRLHSLNHERVAQLFLERIRPRIEAAQADLLVENEQDAIGEGLEEGTGQPEVFAMAPQRETLSAAALASRPPQVIRYCNGLAHRFLLWFLVFNGLHSIANIYFDNKLITFLSAINFMGFVGFVTWAFISQRRSNLDRRLKFIPTVTLIFFVLEGLLSFIYGIIAMVSSSIQNMPKMPSAADLPLSLKIFDAIISLVIAAYGLFVFSRLSSRREQPSPPPAETETPATEEGPV